MVSIINIDRKAKTVDLRIDSPNLQDMIQGLNMVVGAKEDEMNQSSSSSIDAQDRQQHERYKKCLAEMQEVKRQLRRE